MTQSTCHVPEETVHMFLDNALPPAERDTFVAHLQQPCNVCQTRLAETQTLFAQLDSLADVSPPTGITDAVMNQLPAPAPTPQQRPSIFGQLALAGQIAVGVVLLIAAWPLVRSLFARQVNALQIPSPWTAFSDIAISLVNWGADVGFSIGQQLQAGWPPTASAFAPGISVGIALGIATCLGLAWLASNGLLLNVHQKTVEQ